MKTIKSIFTFVLTICIIFTTFLPTVEAKENTEDITEYTTENTEDITEYTTEITEDISESIEDQLKEFLTPFYEDNLNEYVVYDINKNNITDDFFNSTEEFYKTGDWESIKNYYFSNIGHISRFEDIPSRLRLSDSGRTETRMSTQLMSSPYGGTNIKISVTLRGTIHYNPNTYVISDTNYMIVKVTSTDSYGLGIGADFTPNGYGGYSYKVNSTTAKIGVNFAVSLNGYIPYGNFNYSFNMSGR